MRKTIITVALIGMLATLAVSCQKENIEVERAKATEQVAVYSVSYTIDGTREEITLAGEVAWKGFIARMLDLAEEGHRVSFRMEDGTQRIVTSKETITYSTTNREEAFEWAEKMIRQGYSATVEYDKKKKKYNCYAIK